jgi:hypothetical protein
MQIAAHNRLQPGFAPRAWAAALAALAASGGCAVASQDGKTGVGCMDASGRALAVGGDT